MLGKTILPSSITLKNILTDTLKWQLVPNKRAKTLTIKKISDQH